MSSGAAPDPEAVSQKADGTSRLFQEVSGAEIRRETSSCVEGQGTPCVCRHCF